MNQITLFTVVYPGCEPYLGRFFRSVSEQEFKHFDLLILNDGLDDLNNFTGDLRPRIDEVAVSGTIADVRRKGLQLLMGRPAEKIIFADADDYLSPNRIKTANQALEEYDIYVNDLTTVTADETTVTKHYLRHRLGVEFVIQTPFILDKNVIGLGNTAVRKTALQDLPIPSDTIAVDWMIFTDMLLKGKRAVFKSDALSYYRQHEENTAGLKNPSKEKIRKSLVVQLQNASFFAGRSTKHRLHLGSLNELDDYLSEEKNNINIYKQKVEEILPEYPLWWEEIQLLDQLSL